MQRFERDFHEVSRAAGHKGQLRKVTLATPLESAVTEK
jgi:hypothetical protein